VVVGCGGEPGLMRYRAHGTVKYNGKPVPYGRVLFEADPTRGNRGPQGFALIQGGEFDTAVGGGKGTVGGPLIARVTGFDGKSTSDDAPFGGQLFPQYEQALELPQEDTEINLEVSKTK
jgi:hypothetical protein